ncbi:hypothetical protein BOO88_13200 [Stutzerimonas stutzeri]|nr:hypothetical protein BOO89_05690 [Stutzerimonas stutzeri]AZO89839.1 hypothetical protein BOO88_13200 [Stutzerimonas stutzeri]
MKSPCGSGLARDGGVSVDINFGCHTAFASRLAPTGDVGQGLNFWSTPIECRSELARDEHKGDACIQNARVIVNVHREQARSYKDSGRLDLPKATTGQHTGAGQAFRRYNARLDRDKPD